MIGGQRKLGSPRIKPESGNLKKSWKRMYRKIMDLAELKRAGTVYTGKHSLHYVGAKRRLKRAEAGG